MTPSSADPNTDSTSEAEDYADYTDDHASKSAPDPADVQRCDTPDVADGPETEPPD
jgi:hypothetical protein